MVIEKAQWFRTAIQLRGSVLLAVLPRSLFCGTFGLGISLLHYLGNPVSLPFLASLIPNIVLGLLLVFRTNTAYDRFWEGRKCWGTIIINVRNLARQIWVAVVERSPDDHSTKIQVLRLLVAFAVATKLHLRQEPVSAAELEDLLPSEESYFRLKEMNNPPLQIALWIADYLQQEFNNDRLNIHQLAAMHQLLDKLVEALSGCERILRTPMPLAYAIHLKQLLLLYCLSLPFQMVGNLDWWTAPIVTLISFTLFGIEEIGIEIENPFGRDPNDLPLDAICNTMLRNVEDLISFGTDNQTWQDTEDLIKPGV